MDSAFNSGWQVYALTGRPDFLNYLRARVVTWDDLWDFYRQSPADTDAMVRLVGLFHAFHSQDFDREGCVLDRDSPLYFALRSWARFAVECEEYLPESKLCESLASLLGQGLISPLYYEALFGVYLEQRMERAFEAFMERGISLDGVGRDAVSAAPPKAGERGRRLLVRLPGYVSGAMSQHRSFEGIVQRHYGAWNMAFTTALGDTDEGDWRDDGGEG